MTDVKASSSLHQGNINCIMKMEGQVNILLSFVFSFISLSGVWVATRTGRGIYRALRDRGYVGKTRSYFNVK